MLLGRLFCGAAPAAGACPAVAVWRQVPKRVPAILMVLGKVGFQCVDAAVGTGSRR